MNIEKAIKEINALGKNQLKFLKGYYEKEVKKLSRQAEILLYASNENNQDYLKKKNELDISNKLLEAIYKRLK